ncbi:MAG: putative ABC transporter permease [Erysipelotrichaceae bacterium]|jgi:uncharacterized membrane protein
MSVEQLFILFFIYSVIGWVVEVLFVFLESKKIVNRGFLIGPYLPIYGLGAVLITLASFYIPFMDDSISSGFLISFIICGILEYLTSYIMEKRFSIRWWDYSTKPMNLNGRVWIGNLILFGLGGAVIIKLVNPIIFRFFERITDYQFRIASIIILIILITDWIFSHFILKLLRTEVVHSTGDSTEKIAEEIRELFSSRTVFHRRILDAYPNLEYRTDKIKARLEKAKVEIEKINRMVLEKVEDTQNKFKEGEKIILNYVTPVEKLQQDVIDIQDELIKNLLSDKADLEKRDRLIEELAECRKILAEKEKNSIISIIKNKEK